jgi:uncharacterized protein (TIGR02271 family)
MRAERPLFRSAEERIPIVEEQVEVGKREVETGRVRVHTVVDEEKLNLTELLERDVVDIERVPVGREVDQAPLPFEEGDVLVIPVIEERLVVEKRLVVVEEVRIRRRQESAPANIPVTRRIMHAEIERSAPPAPQPGPAFAGADPLRSAPPRGAAPLRNEPPVRNGPATAPQPTPRAPGMPHAGMPHAGMLHESDRRAAAPHPAARTTINWTLIAGVLAVILLLLVIASRS